LENIQRNFIAAEGSTPNLDMKVSPEFTRPSLSRRSMYCRDFDLCLSVYQDVVIPGGNGRGECEKNIKLRAHNMQTFHSGSAKYTNISRRNQVSMALFLCADIHQGDELFSVHSGGKQCAFMSLRRFLQPEIFPLALSAWSFIEH
jgi:hypothetical protein